MGPEDPLEEGMAVLTWSVPTGEPGGYSHKVDLACTHVSVTH